MGGLLNVNGEESNLALDLDLRIPLFVVSSGRALTGLLNLCHALDNRSHCLVVCVKQREYGEYRREWPHLCFLTLPPEGDDWGVGYARFCVKRFAEQCGIRHCVVMDDSVEAWAGVTLANDPQPTRKCYLARLKRRTSRCGPC